MEKKQLPHQHNDSEELLKLQKQLNKTDHFQTVTDILRQFSDPSRARIFWLLCHGEECVINISALMDMSSPAVSHHLKNLKSTGLITSHREGKEVYYRAADTPLAKLLHELVEQIMEISCPEENETHDEPHHEQEELIKRVHDYLTESIAERVTIEELSRKFHMNPTTLKELFKSVYGNSIAAHIREHRMETAAGLLEKTDLSISEIGLKVGYESQSKFSAAFKSYYGQLPKEFRKQRS